MQNVLQALLTSLTLGSWHGFPLVEWVLSPIRELLGITKECMALLPREAYSARPIVVVHRYPSWVVL